MNENNFIYIRTKYDGTNIKYAEILEIALASSYTGKTIYIERQIDRDKSYFKDVKESDTEIGCLYVNQDEKDSTLVRAYKNTDENIVKVIREFIKDNLAEEYLKFLVFKDSFEEMLFLEYINESMNSPYRFLNINSMLFTTAEHYEKALEGFVEESLKQMDDDPDVGEEEYALFDTLKIVIDTLFFEEFFKYILNS